MQNLNKQNNLNYNQYYSPSTNQYLYNKNQDILQKSSNNNTRAFSPDSYKENNKQINTQKYSYLNKQDIPLKNSNQTNIQIQRNPPSFKNNWQNKENISNSPNSQNYFSPIPKQIPENININNYNADPKKFALSTNYNLKQNKKTLILDLDETLVHSGFHPFKRKSDFTLNIKVDGKNHTIYVLKRPYVEEFLSEIAPYYEIIIFTASISEYASPLLDMLDKNKLTSGRLFRQHCLFNHGLYLKDIKIVQKDLKDVIIIDNNPVSYVMNQDNGLPILTWYDDLNDKELLNLLPLLKYLANVNDVREIIKNVVDKQTNKIKFNLVDELIKKKNNDNNNNYNRDIIYQSNDKYNIINNYKNNLSNNANNKKDDFNSKPNYNKNYINNFDENKYAIKIQNNSEYNMKYNINKDEENKIKNYFNNDNNFYKYNNYNNSIHDSLSNMTYNEIQNEGTINADKDYQNNNYNNNNFNKGNQNYVIQKAVNYDNHKHYEEKNKINNNYNKKNELLNNEKQKIEKRDIRAQNNAIYDYKINNLNNYNIDQKKIRKNFSSNTYNPNMRKSNYKYNNSEQKYRKNNSLLYRENMDNNINNYGERYINNLYNNKNREYINNNTRKHSNYINENNEYLENLTLENEKDDNYLKSYQQHLLKLRTNENNYQKNNPSNNNIVNNIHIYQNKNMNSPYFQNSNFSSNINNRNHSINSMNYRRNNMNFVNFNNNGQHLNRINNFYNQRFMNENNQNDLIPKEEKNIYNEELNNNQEDNKQKVNNNLHFYKTQINFLQPYKNRNNNLFNKNNYNLNNNNNNFRFNNNFRRNNDEKDEKIIQPKINNYFNNNELNRSFSGKNILQNKNISNIDLDRKARERKKYDFSPYYMNAKGQNEINIRNINENNNINSLNNINQRNDTDANKEKENDNIFVNNKNNNIEYNNKLFNFSRENNIYSNNLKENYQERDNNENQNKYSQKLSKTDERKFYRSSSSKPNNYNYLYNNDNSRIPRNYNNININNYNFYNSFIDSNKAKNDENRFYNNKYRMPYYINRFDDQENILNRSSSYFHPRPNYNYLLNQNGNSFTPNALKRNNMLKSKFLNNFANYAAFE